ncbi:MAG: N-acetylglucosaminyldiphosphoundecaprenol N-acetyl-beta-D-mannosaminyltransferase [Gaiellaceae bacterium]|nr:N-acetylglucosaminyldiphosphoundecaprenol N-acetyl-beta-D-mannosaminyltransferase [Gaiellaceae bacterium]
MSAVLAERAYERDRGEAASICSAPRAVVLGSAIDAVTLDEAVDAIEVRIVRREPCQHVAINAAKVVRLQHDAQLRNVIAGCELVTADGQAIVWAGRLLGQPLPGRVTGIDLMDAIARRASERGYRVYVLGARQEVLERAVSVLRTRFPRLQLAGYRHGYFGPDDESEVVDSIAQAAPDILFVALETPAKELFLARNRDRLRIPFVMGVGGAVDILGGVRRRAPRWLQRLGLEWAFRLAQDPRRLAGRYVVGNTRFTWLVARELVRQRIAR